MEAIINTKVTHFDLVVTGTSHGLIDILPGGVVTAKGTADINLNDCGEFVYNPDQDIVKVAVVERHQNTGNVALGLLRD